MKNTKTVTTTFKLPLDLDETSTCNITRNSKEGRSLTETKILIWDEMAPNIAFNAVDTLLMDLLNCDEPFGNLIVMLSGDFRQTSPIVKHGNRTQIIENIVKSSNLWKYFQKIESN